jgi:glutamate racemase
MSEAPAPTVLVFDSGLGGLTVFAELREARPDAHFRYVADDAAFPYGRLAQVDLVARVTAVMERFVPATRADAVVIACNTASTLILPALRQRFTIPIVGTVPAIKPAAHLSLSKMISILATPGTVSREYTRELIAAHAAECSVTLVPSERLALLAEAYLRGEDVSEAKIADEIAPCFVQDGARRTDAVALACTHYPLLLPLLRKLAPWPVMWIDPARAIARRLTQLIGPAPAPLQQSAQLQPIFFTSGAPARPALVEALSRRGLACASAAEHALPFPWSA